MFNKLKRAMKRKQFETAIGANTFIIKKTWSILRQAICKLYDNSNYKNNTPMRQIYLM